MHSRRHARGLTLVEVLIVVVLIALLSGGALLGPGLLRSSRVRAAATLIVSGVRLAQNRTNSTGRPVRLVIDLDQRRIWLEQASGSVFSREKGGVAGGAEAQDEAEKKAKAETERILEGVRPPRPRFTPLNDLADPESKGEGREFGSGVQVLSVQTEHDEEPVTEGRAYVYFWPGGITERTIIRLKRSDLSGTDDVTSVLISPLTGKASIQRGNVEFPPPREDPDGSGFGPKEEE